MTSIAAIVMWSHIRDQIVARVSPRTAKSKAKLESSLDEFEDTVASIYDVPFLTAAEIKNFLASTERRKSVSAHLAKLMEEILVREGTVCRFHF